MTGIDVALIEAHTVTMSAKQLRIKADRALRSAAQRSDEKSAASLQKLAADYVARAEAIEQQEAKPKT